jgi:hypothetical protein
MCKCTSLLPIYHQLFGANISNFDVLQH